MSDDEPRRQSPRRYWYEEITHGRAAAVFGGLALAILAVVGEVGLEVAGNEVAAHLRWLTVPAIIVAGLAASVVVAYILRQRERRRQETRDLPAVRLEPLPARADLVARASLVAEVTALASQHAVVLVHGPTGVGVSAVAIEAARGLAPEPSRQVYIDLHGQSKTQPESARRVAIRVLTVIGRPVGRAADLKHAAAVLAEWLRDGDRVVVLDNAARFDQVAWATGAVRGSHLVIAGDVGLRPQHPAAAEGPDVADAQVDPLEPESALELLGRQDGADPHAHQVQARIDADPQAALRLASDYLRLPLVAVEVGRWLADNPDVSLGALVEDLDTAAADQAASWSPIRFILSKQLRGAFPPARRLMALLAHTPIDELPEGAVVALAGQPAEVTAPLLTELVQRSLLTRVRPTRVRVPDEARRLLPPDPGTAKGLVRLAAYYGALASTHAGALGSAVGHEQEESVRWLCTEDTALLQLLRTAGPSRDAGASRAESLSRGFLPREVAPHLWRIADALDTWFSWQSRTADRRATAEAMRSAARQLGDSAALQTALLRLAALARADFDLLESARLLAEAEEAGSSSSGALRAPVEVARGLQEMASGDLQAAHQALARGRKLRARRDIAAKVIDLGNLGAARLHDGRLDDAHRLLTEARLLAGDAGDLAGEAHARELLGIVAARRQDPDAGTAWEQARLRYEQLNDDRGQARCLQHRGALMLSRPDCTTSDRAEAESLIQQSIALRGDDTRGAGPALAHLYLAESAQHRSDRNTTVQHRDRARAALRGWPDTLPRPPLIRDIDTRLAALDPERGWPEDGLAPPG